MILVVARKELKDLYREKRLKGLLLIYLIALLITVVVSVFAWQTEQRDRVLAAQGDRELWVGQEAKNPHDAAHYGMYVFRSINALSVIDPGIQAFLGSTLFLEAHRRNESKHASVQDEDAAVRLGRLSPQFLLLAIFPLILILTGFDIFTKEREQDTLPMLTVVGTKPISLVIGKLLALSFLSLAMLLPVALAGVGLLWLFGEGADAWMSLGVLLTAYACFLIMCCALILLISLWSPSSSGSLILLLVLWFVTTLALPRLTTNVAEERYPYPTHAQFMAAIDALKAKGLDGHNPYNEAAAAFRKATLEEYGVERVEDLPFNFSGLLAQRGEEYESTVYATQYKRIKEQQQQQMKLFRTAALGSPYLATRFLSMVLCRTDEPAHWHFEEAAEDHRLEFVRILNMHNAEHSTYGDYSYRAGPELWSEVPKFDYQALTLNELWSRLTPFAMILLGQGLALFSLLFWSAGRRGRIRFEVAS